MITVQKILHVVSHYFVIPEIHLTSKSRRGEFVYPRHIACWIATRETPLTTSEIGRQMGGRDHTTILHAHNKIAAVINTNQEASRDCINILHILNIKKRLGGVRLPVPDNVDPAVAKFFEIHNLGGLPDREVQRRAGLGHGVMRGWKGGRSPNFGNLQAALGVYGYQLAVVEIEDERESAA